MSIDFERLPKAKIFAAHGVDFTGERDDELIGTCPFTGREGKFFVNSKSWLWDSKTAGLSGSVSKFLAEVAKEYREEMSDELWQKLAQHRMLPTLALKPWSIGWNGRSYTIPIRDVNGRVVDIRMYRPKDRFMQSTPGCHVGLLGAHLLNDNASQDVYLCEGEWDGMAMRWLLAQLGKPGVVLAVPGAGVFKQDWVPWFSGRTVHVIYDHDEAGERGEETVERRLRGVAKALTFTHWPDELPSGFDLRDWVVYGVLKKKTPDKCLSRLEKLFKPTVRTSSATPEGQVVLLRKSGTKKGPSASLEQVRHVFQTHLHLPNTDAVDVMLATVLSQRLDGPPVWMFLVSPPGGAKTITLSALTDYDKVYSTSSLTAHALISGANWQGQTDPSLIPRLHGKILVIKDFTSILGMRDTDKEEIFGILRDAYDGRCGKVFGNGVERSYQSSFTIIAAVTPRIYEIGEQHAALGERFLKYAMGDNLEHHSEVDIISKAIENVDHDTEIKKELAEVTANYLSRGKRPGDAPELDNLTHRRIIALAQFGARVRGNVSWDFHGVTMRGRPFAEIGSRLGIQLAKLARSIAWVRGTNEVTDDEYTLIKKVMLDTVSQRTEDLVRAVFRLCPKQSDFVSTTALSAATSYPPSTLQRMLQDMTMLQVVVRRGSGYRHEWSLSPYIRKCIKESGLYLTDAELGRKSLKVVRLRRRRPRPEGDPGAPADPGSQL